jgi:hypothetical protein
VLGVAGPILGIVLSFMGGTGPDPELLKIQQMIEETQVMISQGFLDLERQLREMDSKGAYRFIIKDLGTLEGLTYKHINRKIPFTIANYRNPCGDDMAECGRAFTTVCNYLEDIL